MDDLTLGQMIFGNGVSTTKTPSKSKANAVTAIQGVAVENSVNGQVGVMVDNQYMRLPTTFAVAAGDICIITVTNNSPMITGIVGKGDLVDNIIDGTIRASTAIIMKLVAGTVDAEKLEAGYAYIKDLRADKFNATEIQATLADFFEIVATNAKFDSLTATKATIDTLEATKAFFDDLQAENIDVEKLKATTALIAALEAEEITTEDLVANNIYVNALEGAYANVEELVADLAFIKDLDVDSLTAKLAVIDTLETTYAKVDMTNIQNGSIKEAYIEDGAISNAKIKEGAIHDANIADATITAAKIHDIDADTITAGTLKTERLLLVDNETGEVSIIKAINVANGVATDVASGTKIQAESIDVIDLWALNATIGGFNISENSLYNAKEAIDDPNSGVYIGLDGVGIGNGNVLGLTDKSPFMMKADGSFFLGGSSDSLSFDPFTGKLAINISNLSIGSRNITQALSDIEGRVTNNATMIEQNAHNVDIKFESVEGDLGEFKNYIRFGSSQNLGSYMELGKNTGEDVKFKTIISNKEGLLFRENEDNVAWINNRTMHITNTEVTGTLAIKNWKWEQRSNGNISFKWRDWENA